MERASWQQRRRIPSAGTRKDRPSRQIFKSFLNVVNLAPILGAREFPEKIKTKNYKAQAGDGSKQQTSIQAQAHGFFIFGWDPPTSV
jgi:hypothetical protein